MSDDRIALGLSRRRFLVGAAATGAGAVALPGLLPRFVLAADPTSTSGHTLVFVFLRGGMDGLSALVPLGDRNYHDARPRTAIDDRQALSLDGRFGLHPALAGLKELWDDGLIAFVPAAGMQMADRSHFARQDALDRGSPDLGIGPGWMARHLASRRNLVSAVPAIDLGDPGRSLALQGSDRGVALEKVSNFGVTGFKAPDRAVEEALRALYGIKSPTAPLSKAAAVTFGAVDALAGVNDNAVPAPRTADYVGALGVRFRQVAILLRSGIGVELANIDVGRWDLHNAQGDKEGRLAMLFTELGQSLAAFAADVSGMLDRVTVVVASEFGRRVAENSSAGTDHGQGGVAMVIGRGVRKGVHGVWPGLSSNVLAGGEDVPIANDVRDILAEAVSRRLGNRDIGAVFPGLKHKPLNLFA